MRSGGGRFTGDSLRLGLDARRLGSTAWPTPFGTEVLRGDSATEEGLASFLGDFDRSNESFGPSSRDFPIQTVTCLQVLEIGDCYDDM